MPYILRFISGVLLLLLPFVFTALCVRRVCSTIFLSFFSTFSRRPFHHFFFLHTLFGCVPVRSPPSYAHFTVLHDAIIAAEHLQTTKHNACTRRHLLLAKLSKCRWRRPMEPVPHHTASPSYTIRKKNKRRICRVLLLLLLVNGVLVAFASHTYPSTTCENWTSG